MKENQLLYRQYSREKKGKTFIKFRVPKPQLPFEYMEIDRWYCLPLKVIVRSDNGAQFAARTVRECLSEMEIQQDGGARAIQPCVHSAG
jgi:transposase InsO family protein